jgi:ABC-type multidrug transport system ATPase subunit
VEYIPPWRAEQALHALVAAVQKPPGLVLLDDPLAPLDAVSRRRGRQYLRELKAARVSMVIAAQAGGEYKSICSREAVMKGGKFLLAQNVPGI